MKIAVAAISVRPVKVSDAPRSSEIGQISADVPRISRKLHMLLPTTLPTAIPGAPFSAASMLTISSGAVVP